MYWEKAFYPYIFVILFIFFSIFSSSLNADYCTASGGGDEYIDSFTFYTYQNKGTGYHPFGYDGRTGSTINLQRGESYQYVIINGDAYEGDQCRIWIDWNQDEIFGTGDEEITPVNHFQYYYGMITVPTDADLGSTRLRIRINYTGEMSPCGGAQYGEVEDYTINVTLPGESETVFETASMGPMMQNTGYQFDSVDYLAVRFELTEPTTITKVGAHIGDFSTEDLATVTFYLVKLANENAFPNYNIFPTKEITLGFPPKISMDYRLNIPSPQEFEPGWYALIVGYDDDYPGTGLMPTDGQTRIGSPTFMKRDSVSWTNYYPLGALRFVVEGITTPTCGDPNTPINPVPWNRIEGVSLDPNLYWTEDNDWPCETTYDVYLDTSNPPTTLLASDLNECSFSCSGLDANTNYFWQVVAKTDSGQTTGPVWSFKTDDMAELPQIPRYYIVDLGIMEQVYWYGHPVGGSLANGLNEKGHVVGESHTGNIVSAQTFFWRDVNDNRHGDPNEMIRAEDIREKGYNSAYGISNNGLVVGRVGRNYFSSEAFKWWDQNGNSEVDPGESEVLPVPTPAPATNYASAALACNDNLMAVGYCANDVDGINRTRACLWDVSANTYTVLGTLGGEESWARAISDCNIVVGSSDCTDGNLTHGFIWVDGDVDGVWQMSEMIEIPTFGGKRSLLHDINKKGHVVGYARDVNEATRAIFWADVNGNGKCELDEMKNIQTIDSNGISISYAINDRDQVVGERLIKPDNFGARRAFYWDKNTGMVDLLDLVCNKEDWYYLITAKDISNKGWIVGYGRKANDTHHAFLMIPEINMGDINCDSIVNLLDLAAVAGQWNRERQIADFYPGGGDGLANLKEYAIFARAWGSEYPLWPYNDLVDFNFDKVIDMQDFIIFVDGYMKPGCYNADVAPSPAGDKVVDVEDLATIAENWLMTTP